MKDSKNLIRHYMLLIATYIFVLFFCSVFMAFPEFAQMRADGIHGAPEILMALCGMAGALIGWNALLLVKELLFLARR
jgi:hypothetical protein